MDINARRTAILRIADTQWFQRMRDDETFYDVKVAGYWVYVLSNWIGSGVDTAVIPADTQKRPHLKSNIGINAPHNYLRHLKIT